LTLLPLFPLDVVLFPGVPLPLHIFEPRYKEMIAECLEQKRPFGIVRASQGGVASLGCTAEIVSVEKRYDDGRLDILARGVRRFEVIEVNQERSFLQAEISLVEDEPGNPPPELAEQAAHLFAEISRLADVQPRPLPAQPARLEAEPSRSGEGQKSLSYRLAGALPLDLDFKQNLLATLSEEKRLEALVEYLRAVLPGLRRASKARWN